MKVPSTVVVTLRLDEAGDVWHVEFSSNSSVRLLPFVFFFFFPFYISEYSDEDLQSSTPKVTILKSTPGPQPHLNKPVVLTPEGKIPEVEIEKTFLQKYWWMILGGALLIMSTSGGGE